MKFGPSIMFPFHLAKKRNRTAYLLRFSTFDVGETQHCSLPSYNINVKKLSPKEMDSFYQCVEYASRWMGATFTTALTRSNVLDGLMDFSFREHISILDMICLPDGSPVFAWFRETNDEESVEVACTHAAHLWQSSPRGLWLLQHQTQRNALSSFAARHGLVDRPSREINLPTVLHFHKQHLRCLHVSYSSATDNARRRELGLFLASAHRLGALPLPSSSLDRPFQRDAAQHDTTTSNGGRGDDVHAILRFLRWSLCSPAARHPVEERLNVSSAFPYETSFPLSFLATACVNHAETGSSGVDAHLLKWPYPSELLGMVIEFLFSSQLYTKESELFAHICSEMNRIVDFIELSDRRSFSRFYFAQQAAPTAPHDAYLCGHAAKPPYNSNSSNLNKEHLPKEMLEPFLLPAPCVGADANGYWASLLIACDMMVASTSLDGRPLCGCDDLVQCRRAVLAYMFKRYALFSEDLWRGEYAARAFPFFENTTYSLCMTEQLLLFMFASSTCDRVGNPRATNNTYLALSLLFPKYTPLLVFCDARARLTTESISGVALVSGALREEVTIPISPAQYATCTDLLERDAGEPIVCIPIVCGGHGKRVRVVPPGELPFPIP